MQAVNYQLRFPCPGNICPKDMIMEWTHCDCGGEIYFKVDGDLYCRECYFSDFIQKWRFNCKQVNHEGDYIGFNQLAHLRQAIVNVVEALENQDAPDLIEVIDQVQQNIKKRWVRR